MKVGIIDCETTISNDGNPFDTTNKLCFIGIRILGVNHLFDIEYSGKPWGQLRDEIQSLIDSCDLVVFFNAKFDMHWLLRYGIKVAHKPIWDTQFVEYVLSGQENQLPSLDDTASRRNIGHKLNVVKSEYWDKGIDTLLIPIDILIEYLNQDLFLTDVLFQQQKDELKENQQLKRLCWWGCQDILVTQEMEYNGIKFDLELSKKIGNSYLEDIRVLDSKLSDLFPYSFLNFGSHENLSALLYGGPVSYEVRESYEKILKSGVIKTKEHWVEKVEVFPRLVEPLKGTALKKKDGNDKDLYFKTDEGTLKKLKAFGKAKQVIEIVLERVKISKKVGTYFHGIPKLYGEMHWCDEILHGQLIHCRAATGRLASNSPNQQNFDEEVRKCIITRFSKQH